ncbi:hypothetical protein RFI_23245, partial [Reticulomyxa filosa]
NNNNNNNNNNNENDEKENEITIGIEKHDTKTEISIEATNSIAKQFTRLDWSDHIDPKLEQNNSTNTDADMNVNANTSVNADDNENSESGGLTKNGVKIKARPNNLYELDVSQWSIAQVGQWISSLGLIRYQLDFEYQKIDGKKLLRLKYEDLGDLLRNKDDSFYLFQRLQKLQVAVWLKKKKNHHHIQYNINWKWRDLYVTLRKELHSNRRQQKTIEQQLQDIQSNKQYVLKIEDYNNDNNNNTELESKAPFDNVDTDHTILVPQPPTLRAFNELKRNFQTWVSRKKLQSGGTEDMKVDASHVIPSSDSGVQQDSEPKNAHQSSHSLKGLLDKFRHKAAASTHLNPVTTEIHSALGQQGQTQPSESASQIVLMPYQQKAPIHSPLSEIAKAKQGALVQRDVKDDDNNDDAPVIDNDDDDNENDGDDEHDGYNEYDDYDGASDDSGSGNDDDDNNDDDDDDNNNDNKPSHHDSLKTVQSAPLRSKPTNDNLVGRHIASPMSEDHRAKQNKTQAKSTRKTKPNKRSNDDDDDGKQEFLEDKAFGQTFTFQANTASLHISIFVKQQ